MWIFGEGFPLVLDDDEEVVGGVKCKSSATLGCCAEPDLGSDKDARRDGDSGGGERLMVLSASVPDTRVSALEGGREVRRDEEGRLTFGNGV